jgi:hypothetical protein
VGAAAVRWLDFGACQLARALILTRLWANTP